MSTSILVIGASGRTGVELLRAAHAHGTPPSMHAFVRTPSKLSSPDRELAASVMKGDALNADDLTRALRESAADTVILTIGRADVKPTELRERSAATLMRVLKGTPQFAHVRVVCVSSMGAGGTSIRMGFGVGKLLTWYIRHVLKDHDKQEEEFIKAFGDDPEQKRRLLIVRPTGLMSGKPKGAAVVFTDEKPPSGRIDRADLAKWIIGEVCGVGSHFGTAVNLTGKK